MLTKEAQTTETAMPEWVTSLLQKYSAGVAHGFILHFNVSDYVLPGVTLRSFLGQLMKNRELVVFYNRSEGITFPVQSMEKKFRMLLQLDEQQNNASSSALAALGIAPAAGQQELPRDPSAALPLLEKLLRMGTPEERTAAVVIEYAEAIAPAADMAAMSEADRTNLITLARWGKDALIAASGNPLFLVTNNISDLSPTLRAASCKYEAIEIPLPSRSARDAYIAHYLDTAEHSFDMELAAAAFSNSTAGLSLLHVEDIFLRAEQEGALTLALVKERKDSIIASEYNEVIEMMEPRFGFEAIGGLQHVKRFFTNSVIRPMQLGNTNRVPMGVLMTGPAGTGKTAVAEAVAKEAGVNAVILNLARIFGQYVGSSERNLEKALRAIESLTPTIVFVDEIDQSVQRNTGGGDSGVSSRVFKRLLEFMSDTGHRGKVVFLAATNRPDLLDAALRRPGRFDKKIPFLVPDKDERAAIFGVMCKRYGMPPAAAADEVLMGSAADETQGWTGAEIEAAVVKATELMYDEDMMHGEALYAACKRLSPSTAAIQFMTDIAIAECNDADLLPEAYKDVLKNRSALQQRIEENRPEGRGKRTL